MKKKRREKGRREEEGGREGGREEGRGGEGGEERGRERGRRREEMYGHQQSTTRHFSTKCIVPDDIPEPLSVGLSWVEVIDLWLQLTVDERCSEAYHRADEISGSVRLKAVVEGEIPQMKVV